MENLNAVLNEQPEQPEQPAQEIEQDLQPEQTGEIAAPPAESETEKQAKGIQAAMLAERQKRQLAEQRAAQLEAQLQRFTQQPERKEPEGPPNPEHYTENPQEYWRLLARYEARQELSQAMKHAQEAQRLEAERQAQQAKADRINAVVMKGQAKYQDYDAAINAGLGPFLTPTLAEAIAESDVGDEVSYWLAKNPVEAARISRLSERQMVREIAKLESKVTAPERPAIPRTLSQARDERGQFAPVWTGPTPLDAIVARKT